MHTYANWAGLAASDAVAQKDEGPGRDTQAFTRQSKVDTTLCANGEVLRNAEKADTTLIATAALAGIELVKLADGSWLGSKWGMVKLLPDAQEARSWLARFTGRPY